MLGLWLVSVLGGLIGLAGSIWLIVKAFQESVGWGIAVLLVPFANLVFAIKHWGVAKKPFLLSLVGGLLSLVIVAAPFVLVGFAASKSFPVSIGVQNAQAIGGVREAKEPATDRDRVADMLLNIGIDPENPRTFVGRTIPEMTEALGAPSATMKLGREHTYIFYNCFEVVSADGGKTVSAVHYMGK
jgi:hypothetical protein